jgi:hypothetical protein
VTDRPRSPRRPRDPRPGRSVGRSPTSRPTSTGPRPGRGAAPRADARVATRPRPTVGLDLPGPVRARRHRPPPRPARRASPSATSSRWRSAGSTSPTATRCTSAGSRWSTTTATSARRLAGPGLRAVLPGDRRRPAGGRPPPHAGHPWPRGPRPRRRGARRRRGRAARARGRHRPGGAARLARRGADRHMRDIVATIQADQDRIIRSPASGTSWSPAGRGPARPWWRCTGSPTCSTATGTGSRARRPRGRPVPGVHRVHRPGPAGSLGEDRAVQRPLEALAPPAATEVAGGTTPTWRPSRATCGWWRSAVGRGRAAAAAAAGRPASPSRAPRSRSPPPTLDRVRDRLLERVRPDRDAAPTTACRRRRRAAGRAVAGVASRRTAGGRPAPDDGGDRLRRRARRGAAGDDAAALLLARPRPGVGAALGRTGRSLDEVAAGILDADEIAALRDGPGPPATGGRSTTSPCSTRSRRCSGPTRPARPRRDAGGTGASGSPGIAARRGRARRRRGRRLPRLRPRRGRRGAGPQPDAVADAGPSRSLRLVDRGGGPRPAQPRRRAPTWEEVAALIGRREVTIAR